MNQPNTFSIVSDPTLSLSYLDALTIGKRSRVAAISILIYDHLASLDREVELMWSKSKRHPVFYLYIFNRFFTLAYYVFDSIPISYDGIVSKEVCVMYLTLDAIVTILATLAVQVILQLRIYVLYERTKSMLVVLLILCTLEALAMGILVALIMTRLFHTRIPDTSVGCAYEQLPKTAFLLFLPGILYEPILCGLVAYKAWAVDIRIPLIRKIARDSIIYFVAIFIELLASALVWALAPRWMNVINPWSAALPSLLGSRLILNMREVVIRQPHAASYILEQFSSDPLGPESDIELAVQVPISMATTSTSTMPSS